MYVKPRSDAIRETRILNRLSQADLAALSGISYSYVNLIESGKRGCSPKVAGRIADALGRPMNALFVVVECNQSEESVTEESAA